MRQRATTRLLPLASLLILTACAQPASSGIPTPNAVAQETASASQAATAAAQAADLAATQTAMLAEAQAATQATALADAAIAAANAAATQAALEAMAPPTAEVPATPQPEPPTATPGAAAEPTQDASSFEESQQEPLPTPRPTARPAARPSSSTCGRRIVHIVQPGQNLFRIALRYRTTINAIARLNGISNTRVISVGQRLVIVTCRRGGVESDAASASPGAVHPLRSMPVVNG